MIDKVFFYKTVREQGLLGRLTQKQVYSIDTIITYWEKLCFTDLRWLAYIFATVKHETANTMLPIEEYGKGKTRAYGKKLKMSRQPYTKPDKIYFGRGYVQLTWYENYETMGRLLGVDLLNKPELALDENIASQIMFEGMTKGNSSFGDFTGKSLEQYINKDICDYKNARKVINGLDKSTLIAGYAKKFELCLKNVA